MVGNSVNLWEINASPGLAQSNTFLHHPWTACSAQAWMGSLLRLVGTAARLAEFGCFPGWSIACFAHADLERTI